MSLTLRAAVNDDREPVLDLLEELFEPPARQPPDYTRARATEGFVSAVTQPEADVLLAIEGGELIGMTSTYADVPSMRFGQRCWVEDLVVRPAHRSAGVGALLLNAAADWARERGCTHLELASAHVRVDAHRFYRARGMPQKAVIFSLDLRDADV